MRRFFVRLPTCRFLQTKSAAKVKNPVFAYFTVQNQNSVLKLSAKNTKYFDKLRKNLYHFEKRCVILKR